MSPVGDGAVCRMDAYHTSGARCLTAAGWGHVESHGNKTWKAHSLLIFWMFDVLLISLISLIWLTTLFCDKICNCWNNSSYLPWLSTQAPHVDSWTTKFPSQDTESVRPAGWVELFSKHTKSWWALPSEFRADEAMRPNLSQEVLERREQNDKGHFVNSLWMFYVDKENTWKETTREKRRLHHITCTSWNLRHRTLDAPGWKSEQTNNIVFQLGLHHVNCCRNHQHCTWSFKGGRSRTLAHVDSRADKLHTEATLPWLLLLKGLFTHSPGYKNYLPVWLINGFNSQLQFSLIFSHHGIEIYWNYKLQRHAAFAICSTILEMRISCEGTHSRFQSDERLCFLVAQQIRRTSNVATSAWHRFEETWDCFMGEIRRWWHGYWRSATGRLDSRIDNPMHGQGFWGATTKSKPAEVWNVIGFIFSPQFGRSGVSHSTTLPRNLKKLQAELYGVSTLERGRNAARVVPCGKDSIRILIGLTGRLCCGFHMISPKDTQQLNIFPRRK